MVCYSLHLLIVLYMLCLTKMVHSQSVAVTLQTSPLIYREKVQLRCTVTGTSCCTDIRIWNKDSFEILRNNQNTSKYSAETNTSGGYFTLIINNLEASDFDKAYSCEYGFFQSTSLSLKQVATTIYPPTESCPAIKVEEGKLTGTLYVAKSAPSPTVFAYWGNENISLSVTGPTQFDTWFYRLTATIDTEVSCVSQPKFSLGVVTSIVTTYICKNEDYCKAVECGFKNWALSLIFPCSIYLEVLLIAWFWKKIHERDLHKKLPILIGTLTFAVVVVLCAVITFPIGIKVVNCLNLTYIASIAVGLLGFAIPASFAFYIHKKMNVSDDVRVQSILCFILLGVLTVGLYYVARKKKPRHDKPADNVALSEAGENPKK